MGSAIAIFIATLLVSPASAWHTRVVDATPGRVDIGPIAVYPFTAEIPKIESLVRFESTLRIGRSPDPSLQQMAVVTATFQQGLPTPRGLLWGTKETSTARVLLKGSTLTAVKPVQAQLAYPARGNYRIIYAIRWIDIDRMVTLAHQVVIPNQYGEIVCSSYFAANTCVHGTGYVRLQQ